MNEDQRRGSSRWKYYEVDPRLSNVVVNPLLYATSGFPQMSSDSKRCLHRYSLPGEYVRALQTDSGEARVVIPNFVHKLKHT